MSTRRRKLEFMKKLIGFGLVLVVLVGSMMALSALKVRAQTPKEGQATEAVSAAGDAKTAVTEAKAESPKEPDPVVRKWAFVMAALAVSIGSIAGGGAVGYVGAAAMGAIGEKPELAGRALIFVGLAEGIAIYGLIIGIMILGKV